MKKLFISQPMRGLTDEEILKERERIHKEAGEIVGKPLELIDSFFDDDTGFPENANLPVFYLGKSISLLAEADIAYFGRGWREARGCIIENTVAREYGITVMEE
ncbi:MAG: DUF4406 domain-containing protein [Bacilli bacterium]|nr:DUF4406 domain-containing protein [Bacilli bacterium]